MDSQGATAKAADLRIWLLGLMADAVIAGIAKVNHLVVITRNTRHFLSFGIEAATPDEAVLLFKSERGQA
ncbi:hypothetical protein [Acidithiobacillus ferrooxidans]|uniref:hypothetical protein n=1 Tax=Acidithiobacillus ferrooxidans TaxID=920 RepID=UPI002147F0DA|nr:hypothetical protein [Acidithiobacillus ferrooxidans]